MQCIICLMNIECLYIQLIFAYCVAGKCAYSDARIVPLLGRFSSPKQLSMSVRARARETEKDEGRVHPRLGLHPSLESACAVIIVSNRWEDAFEEDGGCVCVCVRTLVHLPPDHFPLPSHFLLHCHLSCLHMLSPSAGSSGQSLHCRNSGISYALKVIYHISR